MIRITLRAIGITAILSALILSLNLIVGAQQADVSNPPPDKSRQSERQNESRSRQYGMNKIISEQ